MKKDIAMKWVEALNSGEYDQGDGALKRVNGGYCCLGVLCAISGLGKFEDPLSAGEGERASFLEERSYLPPSVREWAGLKSSQGYFNPDEVRNLPKVKKEDHYPDSVAKLNDNGASFEGIADFIEKNYEKL